MYLLFFGIYFITVYLYSYNVSSFINLLYLDGIVVTGRFIRRCSYL